MKVLLLLLTLTLQLKGGEYDKLLALADKWGLPKPHPDSTYVKVSAYRSGDQDFYHLGFVPPDQPNTALLGFKEVNLEGMLARPSTRFKTLKSSSLEDLAYSNTFQGTHLSLITSIHLLRLGHEELGSKTLKASLKHDAGHHRSPFHIQENQSPESTLAGACIAQAIKDITAEKPDFKEIKRRIEMVLTDFPKLKSEATSYLLTSLQASIDHPVAKPGSIESLIEAYLMSGGVEGLMASGHKENPSRSALVRKGFAAIPHLIKHLDDKRMTNHLMQGFNNFSSYPMTADQVISSLLQDFANNEFGSNWLRRQQGYSSTKEAVEAWWKTAKAMGEKNYVAKFTIVKKEKNEVSLSSDLLLIASDRYPELLPDFYNTTLKSKSQNWEVSHAIASSPKIPLETRKKILLKGIASRNLDHRHYALHQLWEIDQPAAEEILLRQIKKAPKTTKTEYWLDRNADLTLLVSQSRNPAIWKSTHDLLHRADLGMRMELISNLRPPEDAPREILFSFFQVFDRYAYDKTVRSEDSSPKYGGPGAGFPYTRLALGDFIHLHYDAWLELDVRPPDKRFQTPEKWAAYRLTVARAVQSYRRKHHLLKPD